MMAEIMRMFLTSIAWNLWSTFGTLLQRIMFLVFTYFMKWKFKRWWSHIPSISTKTNSHLSPEINKHKNYHDIWRGKSRAWLGTGTNILRG